ncbi:MAG: hypothetical protein SOT07_05790 [Paludibacteraceae bacterium]|nr:hypothetical protein [Paludibacteraceae bacterium]
MKKNWYIFFTALLAMLPCMGGYADDVVDDVYYWADKDATETLYYRGETDENAAEPADTDLYEEAEQPQVVTITFVEDSVTQHSEGMVVKAVIKRY